MSRQIVFSLQISWNFSTYTDETTRLISATGDMAYVPPGDSFTSGRGIISTMNLTLDNSDGRFSPLNTGSAIYSSIQDGKAYHAPCYLTISIDGGSTYDRVFTGVIKWPEIVGGTTKETSKVTVECRSNEEKLLQTRTSTTLADFTDYHDTGFDEGQLITAWLTDAGIDPGDMQIDSGLFVIPWAWLDDESVIEEVWRLAGACGGRFYCDPDGVYIYENAYYWMTNTTSTSLQEALDTDDFSTFEPSYNDRDLFDSILVEAAPRTALSPDTLWEPDEIIQVLSGETRIITARLRQPAYEIDNVTFTALTSGGTDITSDVAVVATKYAQRVVMEITNNHATHAAFMTPLTITGRTVSGSITVEEERNAADHGTNGAYYTTRGGRRKSVRGSVYIQSRSHAAMVAEFLLRQSESPRLTYNLSGCPGKPSRRLGHKISVEDLSLMATSRNAIITRIKWRLSGAGFAQDIEAIDTNALFPYQSTTPGYFVIGTNELGAADPQRGHLFF